jgi:hypothetical protein
MVIINARRETYNHHYWHRQKFTISSLGRGTILLTGVGTEIVTVRFGREAFKSI